jgi:hypothetical protein
MFFILVTARGPMSIEGRVLTFPTRAEADLFATSYPGVIVEPVFDVEVVR